MLLMTTSPVNVGLASVARPKFVVPMGPMVTFPSLEALRAFRFPSEVSTNSMNLAVVDGVPLPSFRVRID
ncbi:MAG: hypothetical protein CMK96_16475 [Pseudomonas sp.]|nr:hypothetical protein [Pseudomonas sp.]